MTIKSSGTLKMTDIVAEFGGTPPFNLSQYYGGGPLVPAGIGVPSSGVLKFSDFYGKTKTMNNYLNATAGPYSGIVPNGAWAAKVIIRGGGGGGSTGAGTNGGGGSDPGCGGGSGYYQSFTIPVTPGQSFSGYIGAGGIGGYAGGGTTTYWIATSDGSGGITGSLVGPYNTQLDASNAAANLNSNDGTGNWVTVTKSYTYLYNGTDGGATTFVYNGTTYTANGGQGAGSVNHNPDTYTLFSGTAADGYPGAGQYSGSWPYDGKGANQDGAGAGAGTGGQGYNEGQVSMHGGNGSTIFSSTSYPGGSHNGWASSGPGGGGDLGPGGNGGSNEDGGQGGLGGGGGGGNSDDWNTNGRGGNGGNGYVYVQWLYHNQSWYSPGTYTWNVPEGIYYIAVSANGPGGGGGGGGSNQGSPSDDLRQGLQGYSASGFTIYRNGTAILSVTGGSGGNGNYYGGAPSKGQDSAFYAGGAIQSYAGQWLANACVAGGSGFAGSGGAGGWYTNSTGNGYYSGQGGYAGQYKVIYLNVTPGDTISFTIPPGGGGGAGAFRREVSSYGYPPVIITGWNGGTLYTNDGKTVTQISKLQVYSGNQIKYVYTTTDSDGSTSTQLLNVYKTITGSAFGYAYSNPLTLTDPLLVTALNNDSYSNGQDGGNGGPGCVRILF